MLNQQRMTSMREVFDGRLVERMAIAPTTAVAWLLWLAVRNLASKRSSFSVNRKANWFQPETLKQTARTSEVQSSKCCVELHYHQHRAIETGRWSDWAKEVRWRCQQGYHVVNKFAVPFLVTLQ